MRTEHLIAFRDLIIAAESAGLEGAALDAARLAFYAETHPADITLPEGWTWDRVHAAREEHNLDPWMVPVVNAPGCTGWITINAARADQAPLIHPDAHAIDDLDDMFDMPGDIDDDDDIKDDALDTEDDR